MGFLRYGLHRLRTVIECYWGRMVYDIAPPGAQLAQDITPIRELGKRVVFTDAEKPRRVQGLRGSLRDTKVNKRKKSLARLRA